MGLNKKVYVLGALTASVAAISFLFYTSLNKLNSLDLGDLFEEDTEEE